MQCRDLVLHRFTTHHHDIASRCGARAARLMSPSRKDTDSIRIPPGLSDDPNESFNPAKSLMFRPVDTPAEDRDVFLSGNLPDWLLEDGDLSPAVKPRKPGTSSAIAQAQSRTAKRHPSSSFHKIPQSEGMLNLPAPSAYRMRRIVGEGGFGQVWESVQQTLGRVIAVKRLRADHFAERKHDSKALRYLEKSFRQEALTTGSLEHPNIVPIYDLGLDELGLPLLAMKLVRGRPWDEVIEEDRHKMPMAEFLAKHLPILIDVSQAVAFAHSRGVVHRDLKPSQVMIGEFGEVLLMDWGLALVYDQDLAARQESPLAHTDFTTWSDTAISPAGTPCFMAPEQTEDSAIHVGPWTDVFLLGGTLYYLLTGQSPHESEDSREAFARAVYEDVELPEKRAPQAEIPSELSELSMKALQRDPKDRLPAAKLFIEGLQDYLTGSGKRREALALIKKVEDFINSEDIDDYEELAEYSNTIERALVLWPSNPDALLLRQTLLAEYAKSALLNRDLKLARAQSNRLDPGYMRGELMRQIEEHEKEQSQAQSKLDEMYQQLQHERDRAEKARGQAEDLVNFMLYDMYRTLQPLSRIELLDKVAQKALEYFEANPEKDQSPEILHKRAKTFSNIGDVLKAKGMYEDALKAYGDSRQHIEILFHREPNNEEWRFELSSHHDRVSTVYFEQGNLEGAMRSNRIALDIRQRLAGRNPSNMRYNNALASSFHQEGAIFWRQGKQKEALQSFRTALTIRRKLLDFDPSSIAFKVDLCNTLNSESWVLRALGDIDDALLSAEESLKLRQELIEFEPENQKYLSEYAWTLKSIALLYEDKRDLKAALDSFRSAVSINERLAELDPTNVNLQCELAFPLGGMGRNLLALGRLDEARLSYEQAVTIQRTLVTKGVKHPRLMRDFVYSLLEYANVLKLMGEHDRATLHCSQGLEISEKLLTAAPENPIYLELVSRALLMKGRIETAKGAPDKAKKSWERAVKLLEPVMRVAEHPAYQQETLAKAMLLLGKKESARFYVEKLLAKGWQDPEFLDLSRNIGLMKG